ncbi:MAG: hypothetical protein LUQ65_08805, partial [Candidatus Helarchaeota archaeon]|nr:hypothetical protein [Candidatus Helarchaeota archaeon]
FCQIYLNGLFDYPSSMVLNEFSYENKLICNQFFKAFNRYPIISMDMEYVEWMSRFVKTYLQYEFTADQIRQSNGTSNLFVFEKSYCGVP